MSIDSDFFGLTEEVTRPIAHSLSLKRREGNCWGLNQKHLPAAKSGSVLRVCLRRNHHGYALAVGMEGSVVGNGGG